MTFCNSYGKLLMSLKEMVSLGVPSSGEKRVQEEEFKIEVGVTRGKPARTGPLSRRYKTTMKIVLRWAFKEFLKAGVVCPECNSVLEAENNVPVEW